MNDPIASREFQCISASGEHFPLLVEVGRPCQINQTEWRCAVSLGRLVPNAGDSFGADSWQALLLALSYVHIHLRHFLERGGRLYYSDESGCDAVPDERTRFSLDDFPDYLTRTT